MEGNWDLEEEKLDEPSLPLVLNMFVNHGAVEFGEGLKAKKTVKQTKANINPYTKATVLLVLTREKMLLRSEITVPPLTGKCFVGSAMEVGGFSFSFFSLLSNRDPEAGIWLLERESGRKIGACSSCKEREIEQS